MPIKGCKTFHCRKPMETAIFVFPDMGRYHIDKLKAPLYAEPEG